MEYPSSLSCSVGPRTSLTFAKRSISSVIGNNLRSGVSVTFCLIRICLVYDSKSGNHCLRHGLSAICRQLKLTATDGKRYSSDCLTQKGVDTVLLVLPGKYRAEFSDWIAGMASPLDERSKQRSYELWDSPILDQDWWELSRGSEDGATPKSLLIQPLDYMH